MRKSLEGRLGEMGRVAVQGPGSSVHTCAVVTTHAERSPALSLGHRAQWEALASPMGHAMQVQWVLCPPCAPT